LIDSLSETGLRQIQCVSFVNPKNVPGWADAEAVAAGFRKREGVIDGGR
jgi:hydroxymethylglutaryl-CoA lyase